MLTLTLTSLRNSKGPMRQWSTTSPLVVSVTSDSREREFICHKQRTKIQKYTKYNKGIPIKLVAYSRLQIILDQCTMQQYNKNI